MSVTTGKTTAKGTTDRTVHRGLAGVVADTTTISGVSAESSALIYRGYPVQELAARRDFLDVVHLLWHGELPTPAERAALEAAERGRRELPDPVTRAVLALPVTAHPMDVLRTAVSVLGAEDPDGADLGEPATLRVATDLLARLPGIVALDFRRRHGLGPVAPDPGLGYAENFFHQCFGQVPDPAVVRCFEVSLVLYAEHSFNASTFTARLVASTLSDTYSAVTAAVGALKGPLHGGANEAVMHTMLRIGDPDRAADWVRRELEAHRKIMGFGHRVYVRGDSRVPTMHAALTGLAAIAPRLPEPWAERGREAGTWLRMYDEMARAMDEARGIRPNLDFPAGPAYYLMGFDIPMFTPIFVMSRVSGWAAHIMEQRRANALIRPLSAYEGAAPRSVPEAG